jgi:hypothetical protein
VSDVAVSSFALFHGGLPATRPLRRTVVQPPPSHIVAQQTESQGSGGGMASLDAVAEGAFAPKHADDDDDDLFAVTLSPRSPDMTQSPFSFSVKDVQR